MYFFISNDLKYISTERLNLIDILQDKPCLVKRLNALLLIEQIG
jgi:hypothetical protein